jgi:AAA15 family ATPase/GTPase
MKSRDQQFLEEAYKKILKEKYCSEGTFPGAPDVKIPWKQTDNQALWSQLHHQLRALANSNKPQDIKRKEEKEIIAQLQRIVDTDPKFKNEYVSKPLF